MGGTFSNLYRSFFPKKPLRILMVGLDSAGKTSILYKLKMGESVTPMPTVGFNVETIEHKNISLLLWDVGGQMKLRSLWRHYYENTQGLIFVIDSTDRDRIYDSKIIFHNMLLEDALLNAVILLIANKQDIADAMSTYEIRDLMELYRLKNRKWMLYGCSAVTGYGLYEALDWLQEEITKKKSVFPSFFPSYIDGDY